MDISDFVRVYQWRVRRLTLCAMWQRKGRAALQSVASSHFCPFCGIEVFFEESSILKGLETCCRYQQLSIEEAHSCQ